MLELGSWGHSVLQTPALVLSFYDFQTHTHGFVYLEFVKFQHAIFCKMQRMHICYTVVLYTDMSRLSSYIEINRILLKVC